MNNLIPREEYLLWLPKKRMAGWVIITNSNDEIIDTKFVSLDEVENYVTHKWLLNRVHKSVYAMKNGPQYFESV